jgi:hypothetical protein
LAVADGDASCSGEEVAIGEVAGCWHADPWASGSSPLQPKPPEAQDASKHIQIREAETKDLDFGFGFLPVLGEMGEIREFRCFLVVQI